MAAGGKKMTKEDTWRPTDLLKHMQGQEDESRRRGRSHRDPEKEKRKHGEESVRRGEARDEREKESRRGDVRDEREKESRRGEARDEREKESRRGDVRDEREKESRRGDVRDEREKESRRERERDQGESQLRDREKEKQREKYKDRETKKERDRDGLRERVKGRDRGKDSERDKRNTEKEGKKERDREKDREREKEREREKRHRQNNGDRLIEQERDRGEERDGERERRKKEREHERRREKRVSLTVNDASLEREREREHRRGGEEQKRNQREQDRREKHSHRQQMGHTDGDERRERRNREKEQHSRFNHEDGENELERRHRRQDQHRQTLQEVKPDVPEESREGGAEDHGKEDYMDDFENYEEDFEEFDEEEEEDEKRSAERDLSPQIRRQVEVIQRAMEKENELLSTTHSTSSTQESEISLRASADSRKIRMYGRVIDFTAARQRNINQQEADKQKKRSAELLRLIDLDFSVTECFLDLPRVREYDLYIKSYGMANTKQAYVQSNEDNVERDTQTEETELIPKWTQHPAESSAACGGPQVSQNASGEAIPTTTVDPKRLAAFLCSAAQVMAVLLEENVAESNSVKKIQSEMHTHSFSDGCVQLNTQLNLLQGRQVTLLHFSQTQTHTMLSVHALYSGSSDVTLDSETLICVWNIWEPSTPQSILVYETEVRSCCFSPGRATLVFAGTDVGSVLVWDLREPSSSHTHIGVCEEAWTLRHPTFSTDAVLSGVGHFSSVVSVEPVPVNVGAGLRDPLLSGQEESLGLSFHLGSLDENGLLNLWVVVELPKADESGSQTDLGLRPGGKVKLLHSSSLQTTPQVDNGVLGVTSHLSSVLKFLPSDSNHYFIGSNMGLVKHGTRHGLHAVPKLYKPKDGERPAEVTALDFCSTGEPFFLVGCSDGSVRLHALARADAVCEWTLGSGRSSVRCVLFSPTRCSVFCALDSASVLHIWNLTQRDDSPLITHDLATDPVSAMTVFGDAARKNPYSGIALAKRSGKLEIHFLIFSLALPQDSDAEILHSLTRDTL